MNAVLSDVAVSAIHNWRDKANEKHKVRKELGQESSSSDDPKDDHSCNHTIDIELPPRLNEPHANHQSRNGEINGFHHSDANSATPGQKSLTLLSYASVIKGNYNCLIV